MTVTAITNVPVRGGFVGHVPTASHNPLPRPVRPTSIAPLVRAYFKQAPHTSMLGMTASDASRPQLRKEGGLQKLQHRKDDKIAKQQPLQEFELAEQNAEHLVQKRKFCELEKQLDYELHQETEEPQCQELAKQQHRKAAADPVEKRRREDVGELSETWPRKESELLQKEEELRAKEEELRRKEGDLWAKEKELWAKEGVLERQRRELQQRDEPARMDEEGKRRCKEERSRKRREGIEQQLRDEYEQKRVQHEHKCAEYEWKCVGEQRQRLEEIGREEAQRKGNAELTGSQPVKDAELAEQRRKEFLRLQQEAKVTEQQLVREVKLREQQRWEGYELHRRVEYLERHTRELAEQQRQQVAAERAERQRIKEEFTEIQCRKEEELRQKEEILQKVEEINRQRWLLKQYEEELRRQREKEELERHRRELEKREEELACREEEEKRRSEEEWMRRVAEVAEQAWERRENMKRDLGEDERRQKDFGWKTKEMENWEYVESLEQEEFTKCYEQKNETKRRAASSANGLHTKRDSSSQCSTNSSEAGVGNSPASGGSGSYSHSSPLSEADWRPRQGEQIHEQEEQAHERQEQVHKQQEQLRRDSIRASWDAATVALLTAGGREQVHRAWSSYESAWATLKERPVLYFRTMPWPVLKPPMNVEELTADAIVAFLLSPAHSPDKSARKRLREQLLRWHPDRFASKWLFRAGIEEEAVRLGANQVVCVLNELMAMESNNSFE